MIKQQKQNHAGYGGTHLTVTGSKQQKLFEGKPIISCVSFVSGAVINHHDEGNF